MPSEKHWREDQKESLRELVERRVTGKTPGQDAYLKALRSKQLVTVMGPAGSGKTYLAVWAAVRAIKEGVVDKIVLSRPMKECGEKMPFLPGDIDEKFSPWFQPMLDALHDFLRSSEIAKMIADETLVLCPLEIMRGRSFKRAFVIADEAQNMTKEQMRMFLTRIGDETRMVVMGDPTQTDLQKRENSLVWAMNRIDHPHVGKVRLSEKDIVRSSLCQAIVEALK